jgi:hypothetical protein
MILLYLGLRKPNGKKPHGSENDVPKVCIIDP